MYKTQKDFQQRSHHAPSQVPSDPRVSHSNMRKSKKNFTKKDATTRSIGLRSTKPENFRPKSLATRCHAQPRSFKRPAAQALKTVQICSQSQKSDNTRVFHGLISTRPENFRSRIPETRLHAPPEGQVIPSVVSRPPTRRQGPITRPHAPTRISHPLDAPTRYTRQALTRGFSAMTSCMTSYPTDPV